MLLIYLLFSYESNIYAILLLATSIIYGGDFKDCFKLTMENDNGINTTQTKWPGLAQSPRKIQFITSNNCMALM